MKRWWLIIVILLSVGMNIGVLTSMAVGRMGAPARQDQVVRPVVKDRLNLLCDHLGIQGDLRQRFIARQRRFLRETEAPRKRLNELRRAVRTELTAPKPNRLVIDQLGHEVADTYQSLEQRLVDNVVESRAMLPPAAEAKYVEIVSRLRLEGPGQYGRLPKPLWSWWRSRPLTPAGDSPPSEVPERPANTESPGQAPSQNPGAGNNP